MKNRILRFGLVLASSVFLFTFILSQKAFATKDTYPDAQTAFTGGATSHAAVVARSMNKPCIVSCRGDIGKFVCQDITIDGSAGTVYSGLIPVTEPSTSSFDWVLNHMYDSFGAHEQILSRDFALHGSITNKICVSTYDTNSIEAFQQMLDKVALLTKNGEGWDVVLNLESNTDRCSESDLVYMDLLELPVQGSKHVIEKIKAIAEAYEKYPHLSSVVSVITPSTDNAYIDLIIKCAVAVVPRITSIAELLKADGHVILDTKFVQSIGGNDVLTDLTGTISKAHDRQIKHMLALTHATLLMEKNNG